MATKKKLEDTGVLPVNFFDDVVSDQATPIISYEYKYGDKTVEVKCRRFLTYNDKDRFIKSVWDAYYSADSTGRSDYRPYFLDLVIKFLTVLMYTVNVPISVKDDISKYESFLVNTDFIDRLLEHINITDYKELINATHEYVERRCNLQLAYYKSTVDISMSKLFDTLSSFIDDLKQHINDGDLDGAVQLLSNALSLRGDNDGENKA